MNPYLDYVNKFSANVEAAKSMPLGGIPSLEKPEIADDAPVALIFAPHPDDECIQGGVAIRLFRDSKVRVIDVPVTYGSNVARKQGRKTELENAMNYVGWEIHNMTDLGFDKINPAGKETLLENWATAVDAVAKVLTDLNPDILIFPHEKDWNTSHIGVNYLVLDALAKMPKEFTCKIVLSEYWGQIYNPNMMIELSNEDVADLVATTSFHVEEVERNPYHLSLPAYLNDCVRRGGEVVGGQGGAVPDFNFAGLYTLKKWEFGQLTDCVDGGLVISKAQDPASAILAL